MRAIVSLVLTGHGRAAISVLAAIISACSPHPTPTFHGSKGGDGILRVALGNEPATLNPNLEPDEYALLIGENIFSKLIALASDGTVIPDLAESWQLSDDGVSYTFQLRRNVRWHDGRPFTSEDVRATFVRIRSESWNTDVASRIASAEALDPHTVVVRLKQPWAAFIPALASYATSILPSHIYRDAAWSGNAANDAPIGTGPFRFKSWQKGKVVVLEKNVEYFGPGPYLDEVQYDLAHDVDPASRLIAGDIDLIVGRPPPDRLAELAHADAVRLVTAPSDGRTYLAFNMRRSPFDDARVRRAVNLALDRRALVRVTGGFGAPAFGFYTPSVAWAYNDNARVPAYDPAQARRLMSEAVTTPREWTIGHLKGLNAVALDVARQLHDIGIAVRLVPVTSDYLARARSGEFDLTFVSGVQGPDPDNLSTRFGSRGALQFMGYSNAELDRALDEGGRSSDAAVRARAYFRVQEILARDLPVAPLIESVRVAAFRSNLRGHHQDDALGLVPDYNFSLIRRVTARESR